MAEGRANLHLPLPSLPVNVDPPHKVSWSLGAINGIRWRAVSRLDKRAQELPRLPLDRSKCQKPRLEDRGRREGQGERERDRRRHQNVLESARSPGQLPRRSTCLIEAGRCDVSEMDSANAWPGTGAHLDSQGSLSTTVASAPPLRVVKSPHQVEYKGPRAPWCSARTKLPTCRCASRKMIRQVQWLPRISVAWVNGTLPFLNLNASTSAKPGILKLDLDLDAARSTSVRSDLLVALLYSLILGKVSS